MTEDIVTANCPGYAPATKDLGRVRLCAASTKPADQQADLIAALELLLPFAVAAPAWAIEAARDAIKSAKGEG